MLYYFDSSVLLAILLDEKRKEAAIELWKSATIRLSSILLKLETITVIRRTYEHNRSKLEPAWLTNKLNELNEYLQEVNFRIIDEEIERTLLLKKDVSKCRTLDAIHIATAIGFSELIPDSPFFIYTFDAEMAKVARIFRFRINENAEENYLR